MRSMSCHLGSNASAEKSLSRSSVAFSSPCKVAEPIVPFLNHQPVSPWPEQLLRASMQLYTNGEWTDNRPRAAHANSGQSIDFRTIHNVFSMIIRASPLAVRFLFENLAMSYPPNTHAAVT